MGGGLGVVGDDSGKLRCHDQLWPNDKEIKVRLLLVTCPNEL